MTKGQIRKYVAYENVAVSLLSVLAGIVLGSIFSKLFFMAVEAVLGIGPVINFMISTQAVLVTALCFFILFQAINIFSLRKINSRTIVTQLKSTKVPKPVPKFSKSLAVLGILMVAAGYAMAWVSNMYIIVTMFPVLGLTVTGTYFLYTQFSVAAARRLQNNKRVFYKKTNMIVISQIIYKLRDNAKVLFLVSILGAVTLTAAGTLYSLFDESQKGSMELIPRHMSIIEENINSPSTLSPNQVRDILNKYNIKITMEYKIDGIKGTWKEDGKDESGEILAISCSDYNIRAKNLGLKPLKLTGQNIAVIQTYPWMKNADKLSIDINGKIQKTQVVDNIYAKVLSAITTGYSRVAVLGDEYYVSMVKNIPDDKKAVYFGYDMDNWKAADGAMEEIRSQMPKDSRDNFYESVTSYTGVVKSQAIVMLIGLFVALLFLIATGSIIYFKLFTELQGDRAEFASLIKMGMSKKEMKRIINIQMIIIFFLPFVVAASHSSFALKTLSDILKTNLVAIGLTVVSVYLVFQIIYFVVIKWMYGSQLNMSGQLEGRPL
jgi:putative ABC transport system permease protein